jgi:phosphoketolase
MAKPDSPRPSTRIGGRFKQFVRDKLVEHEHDVARHGEELPEVRAWKWPY